MRNNAIKITTYSITIIVATLMLFTLANPDQFKWAYGQQTNGQITKGTIVQGVIKGAYVTNGQILNNMLN
ncbi:MAG TPA: hypothetical protein VIY08_07155, partial [Candidatus Nitrosocosmicus sp.]